MASDSSAAGGGPRAFLQKALSTLQAADERVKKLQIRVCAAQERVRQDVGKALLSRLTHSRQRSLQLRPAFASLQAAGGGMNSPTEVSREEDAHLTASRVANRPTGKVSGSLWGPRGARAKGDDQPAKESAPYATHCIYY
jgi:hypothetical protein